MTPARQPDKFERLGYGPKHQRRPLTVLDSRALLLCEYMVFGAPSTLAGALERMGKQPGEPLSVEQAGDLVGLRRRNARWIFKQPLFQKAFATEIEGLRSGAKVAAIRKMIDLIDDEGEGRAADRKVQLEASSRLLGLDERAAGAVVNVNVGMAAQVAGYVIDLSPVSNDERAASCPVIEADAIEIASR
ncbi:MAG: hypothetical protein U1E30_12745 [Rhodoblastus sp.]